MTRVAIALIILFSLAGAFYAGKLGCNSDETGRKLNQGKKQICVFAVRDIPAGATIQAKDLRIKYVTTTDSTRYALHAKNVALNKRARQRIPTGQMLSVWDFEPVPHRVMFH